MVERKLRIANQAINDLRTAVADEVYYTAKNKGEYDESEGRFYFALDETIEVGDPFRDGECIEVTHFMIEEDSENAYLYDSNLAEDWDVMDLDLTTLMQVAKAIA